MELKPCPFCGQHGNWQIAQDIDSQQVGVKCMGCYADGPLASNKTKARNAWNRRASDDAG